MTRRAGITLTESLVALFVAALGMISLLVLFPLGAIQIGQALKDERTAQCAQKAEALMRNHWRTEVVERAAGRDGDPAVLNSNPPIALSAVGADPFVIALTDPNALGVNSVTHLPSRAGSDFPHGSSNNLVLQAWVPRLGVAGVGDTIPILGNGPSYPVFIDPIGWRQTPQSNVSRVWLSGDNSLAFPTVPCIPRRTLRRFYTQNTATGAPPAFPNPVFNFDGAPNAVSVDLNRQMVEYCSLLDDLTYDEGGSAGLRDDPTSPTRVERLGRYNWAAIVQRPNNNIKYVANLTILVFENRAAGYFKAGSELQYPRDDGFLIPPNTTPFQTIILNPGATSFQIAYAGDPPPISKGRWIMDGTINNAAPTLQQLSINSTPIPGPTQSIRNANFYRVVSVTDDPANSRMNIEIHPPIQQPLGVIPPSPPGVFPTTFLVTQETDPSNGRVIRSPVPGYSAQIYVLEGLSEVFQKPALQPQLHSSP